MSHKTWQLLYFYCVTIILVKGISFSVKLLGNSIFKFLKSSLKKLLFIRYFCMIFLNFNSKFVFLPHLSVLSFILKWPMNINFKYFQMFLCKSLLHKFWYNRHMGEYCWESRTPLKLSNLPWLAKKVIF